MLSREFPWCFHLGTWGLPAPHPPALRLLCTLGCQDSPPSNIAGTVLVMGSLVGGSSHSLGVALFWKVTTVGAVHLKRVAGCHEGTSVGSLLQDTPALIAMQTYHAAPPGTTGLFCTHLGDSPLVQPSQPHGFSTCWILQGKPAIWIWGD